MKPKVIKLKIWDFWRNFLWRFFKMYYRTMSLWVNSAWVDFHDNPHFSLSRLSNIYNLWQIFRMKIRRCWTPLNGVFKLVLSIQSDHTGRIASYELEKSFDQFMTFHANFTTRDHSFLTAPPPVSAMIFQNWPPNNPLPPFNTKNHVS